MIEKAAELVMQRNEFYRDNYRRVLIALMLMVIINAVLVGMLFYQLTHPPLPQYFATSADGKIVKLQPLENPVLRPEVLLQWAERAAVASYFYNFVDYRKALQDLQNKFTPNGWAEFEKALKSSRILQTVIAKKLVLSAVATGAPVILDQGVIDGRYVWKVNLPILVSFESTSELTQSPYNVTMIITRVPTIDRPEGIAVDSYIATAGRIQGT